MQEQPRARRWRLHAFEDPRLAVPDARPVWHGERLRSILGAVAGRAPEARDAFVLADFLAIARLAVGAHQHLLLSDGFEAIRLDVAGRSLMSGAVCLRYRIAGFESARAPIAAVQRLVGLVRSGSFPPLPAALKASPRHILVLRAFDAVCAGVTQREIAETLLARNLERTRWRIEQPSLRSRAQRLVRAARAMAAGGFWRLLE